MAVLGFTWDADGGGFDEHWPIAACDHLAPLLTTLRDLLATHALPKPALLAHRIGNIVADLAMDELVGADGGTLRSNLVLTSAAVETKRHAK